MGTLLTVVSNTLLIKLNCGDTLSFDIIFSLLFFVSDLEKGVVERGNTNMTGIYWDHTLRQEIFAMFILDLILVLIREKN